MSDTSSSKSQYFLTTSTRVQETPQLQSLSNKYINEEERGWNEQLKFRNGNTLKRKAASSGLNSFARKLPATSKSQALRSWNLNEASIDNHRRQRLIDSGPELSSANPFKGVYRTSFNLERTSDWNNFKPINRVPSTISHSSGIHSSSYAYQHFPSRAESSIGNLTDLSTVSLSRFPEPPRPDYYKIFHPSRPLKPTDHQSLLPIPSPVMIQFPDGTFDVLNPHKSLCDTTVEHPEEEKHVKNLDPPLAISHDLRSSKEALEQAGEIESSSREGSIRPRPLYDDLNSAYQSITSRKTNAYLLQTEPTLGSKPQIQASSNSRYPAFTADEKDLTANDTQSTSTNKRESHTRFLQRIVRAFSLRKSTSDDSIARSNSAKHCGKSRGYLSDIISNNVLNVGEPAENPQQDLSSDNVDIEMGRRRPVPASFNSLFDWTDDGSDYPPSVYYRNSFSNMGASSKGTNLWSIGDNDYSVEFGSNPYMHQTNTDESMEDGLSFSDGIEPRIESTIGSILNRYNHARESCQAIPSAIFYSRSSISSSINQDDQHTAKDGNMYTESIVSHGRPISKMLPPPLLQRANPAYSGHPPQLLPPTPNDWLSRGNPGTWPESSVPSNIYSTSSSYGNTRDLLLMSQSALSACRTERSDLALITLSNLEPNVKSREFETATGNINEVVASRVMDHDSNAFNLHSHRIPGIPSQRFGQQAATHHNEISTDSMELISWKRGATKMKAHSSEMEIRNMLDNNNCREIQEFAQTSRSNCESSQPPSQRHEDLYNWSSPSQIIKRTSRCAEDDVEPIFSHIDDKDHEDESQDWETVAEPSQPNFSYGRLPEPQHADDNKIVSERDEIIAVPYNYHVLQEINTVYQNDIIAANYVQDFASLLAEPHDDIEYNIAYSWKGVADHAQAYNNRKNDDSTENSNFCYNNLLQNLESKDVAANHDIAPTSGLILQSSPIESSTRQSLRRTKNFELEQEASKPNESSQRAAQELHSGDLLTHNCRSAQPSQICIPPRYKSLKPENLALQTNDAIQNQTNVGVQPSQAVTREERDFPRMRVVTKNRRKRASVPSQTRLMSFSLTSRDKLLPKSPTSHGSPNSNFVFHTHSSSASSPRKFDSAPCLRRRDAIAATNPKSRQNLKLKLSWLLFGACCLFPPALVCYGVGWMDAVVLSLSRGKVEHVGRTQRRVALLLGSFVCTVGAVIIITVIIVLHLKRAG